MQSRVRLNFCLKKKTVYGSIIPDKLLSIVLVIGFTKCLKNCSKRFEIFTFKKMAGKLQQQKKWITTERKL